MVEQSVTSKPLFSNQYLGKLIMPLVAEQFLAMTIGACDTIMVSSIGEAGVSGVSLIDQFSQLMIQLFAAFTTGGAVVSSQYLGHKDEKLARQAAKQLLNLGVLAGLIIIAVCMPLRRQILNLVFGKIEFNVMNNALTYFVWILLSFPFLAVYNGCAALYRSMGNSKLSLKVSLVMNFINIAGNALFIYGLKIGVTGAALATFLSRVIAAVVMVILLCNKKKNVIYLDRIWHFEWNSAMVLRILKIGVPSGIENSVFHIGKILVQSFMSSFGTIAIAANAIANTICGFANVPGNAIGLASVTVVGQCIGAGEKKQAKSYGLRLMLVTFAAMFVLSALIFAACPYIVQVFNLTIPSKRLAIGVVRTCMIANIFFWPLSFTMPNILRAAGDAKYTMIVSNVSMWAFRVVFSYVISYWIMSHSANKSLALYGVWIGMYLDWVCRSLMFGLRFAGTRWLDKKVI